MSDIMKMNRDEIIQCSDPDEEWLPLLREALNQVDSDYLSRLVNQQDWLPGLSHLFAAFSLPLSGVNYILLGESPYPRPESANGYAFWDDSVASLWSENGLSKAVNRATSLRNWIKALIVASGHLEEDLSQAAIANVIKTGWVQTAKDFFEGMMDKGFLLSNACLVYTKGELKYHAKHWQPFIYSLFNQLAVKKPSVQLVLFGKIADNIPKTSLKIALRAEHPFNLSFIRNPDVLMFFKPLDLLATHD